MSDVVCGFVMCYVKCVSVLELDVVIWFNCLVIGEDIVMFGMMVYLVMWQQMLDIYWQMLVVFCKIVDLVSVVGGILDSIIKLVIYLIDIVYKDEVGWVCCDFFGEQGLYFCFMLVEVSVLVFLELMVEIDVYVWLGVDLWQVVCVIV